jgi:hypothetical protein
MNPNGNNRKIVETQYCKLNARMVNKPIHNVVNQPKKECKIHKHPKPDMSICNFFDIGMKIKKINCGYKISSYNSKMADGGK